MATTETRKMVLAAAAVCDEKKAEDTRVLELDPADSGFTDFFLITSGNNTRQTVAIADDIELKMKREFGTYANSVEGRRTGEWILMDYVDFVVHIFVEEKRAFYDIERLRKSARSVDLTQLKAALKEKTAAVRRSHPRPSEAGKDESASQAGGSATKTPASGKKVVTGKIAERKTGAKKKAAKIVPRGTIEQSTGKIRKAAPAKKSATRIAAASTSSKSTSLKKSGVKKVESPKLSRGSEGS